MNIITHSRKLLVRISAFFGSLTVGLGQGTFQNLDFENGSFIPIPGDPYGRVQWPAAMPGWRGYVGTNQIDRLMYNNLFLDFAGVDIWGPDHPATNLYHGRYFVVLQSGLDPLDPQHAVASALAQVGTIPLDSQSIRVLYNNPFAIGVSLSFDGANIPLVWVGTSANGGNIWGGDVSALAGQTGDLRFQGSGYMDYIQFSSQPIPEPGQLGFLVVGLCVSALRARPKERRRTR